jgi:hypothetical protein
MADGMESDCGSGGVRWPILSRPQSPGTAWNRLPSGDRLEPRMPYHSNWSVPYGQSPHRKTLPEPGPRGIFAAGSLRKRILERAAGSWVGGFVSSQPRKKGFGRAGKTCSQGWNRVCDSDNEKVP